MPEGEGVDVRVVDASVEEICRDVVASAGARAVWLVGGGNVASQFADVGLIKELMVTVVPVLLGDGKPLFDRPPSGSFQLLGPNLLERDGRVALQGHGLTRSR